MKKYAILAAFILFATLLPCTLCAAQNARYFKAEHGVAAPIFPAISRRIPSHPAILT